MMDKGNSEKAINSDKLINQSKYLCIIDTSMVGEPFRNHSSFVSLNGTIKLIFNQENPFATNGVIVIQ